MIAGRHGDNLALAFFIGALDSPWALLDRDAREPYLTLDGVGIDVPRYGFVLTLSDDPDPERLRFTTGQSHALAGRLEIYTFLVNRAFDWSNGSPIMPHFMAGLGMTYTDRPRRRKSGEENG